MLHTSVYFYRPTTNSQLGRVQLCHAVPRERLVMETRHGKQSNRKNVILVRPGPEGELILPNDGGSVLYISAFLSRSEADALLEQTAGAKSWARSPITLYGKSVLQPRDTAYFGTKRYSYSNERREPTAWEEDPPASTALNVLRVKIEQFLGLPKDFFNVALCNKYNSGEDYMGYHADNEKSLGPEPLIASVSIGAERRFLLRPNVAAGLGPNAHKTEYVLRHGSLLVMKGRVQQCYKHALPKVALSKCNEVRLNFTYRRVVEEEEQEAFRRLMRNDSEKA